MTETVTEPKLDAALRNFDNALALLANKKPGKTFRPVFNEVVSLLEPGQAWILNSARVPVTTVKKYVYLLNYEKEARYKTQRSLDGRHITVYRVE